MDTHLDIGDVAKRSGLPVSTLRFYEEKGLIESIGRHGLRRLYDAGVMERLALITLGRTAGFSLDEIAMMFSSQDLTIDRQQLAAKAEQLDRTIKELTVMRDRLLHAAHCPAPIHTQCPTFQRLIRVAVKAQKRMRKTVTLKSKLG